MGKDILKLKDYFLELTTQDTCESDHKTHLGRLAIFEGVKKFPVRVKCATLVWRALESALNSEKESSVTTE